MGNCLEPSESEVQRARRAKRRKMAALEGPMVGAPPPMAYPYVMNPYNDPRLTGIYISEPPQQPSAYAVVDPRTGQGFIVRDPNAMPMHVPFMDERMMNAHNNHHNHNNKKHSVPNTEEEDAVDGNKEKKSRGRTSKRNSTAEKVDGGMKTSTMNSKPDGLQNNAPFEMTEIETADAHANHEPKTHQNGHVGMDLYTKSGVMELEAETEPIIIDFLDPIPPTIITHAETHTSLSNVEYETVKENDDFNTKTANGHVTQKDDEFGVSHRSTALGNSISSHNEYKISTRSHETVEIIDSGSSSQEERNEMVNQFSTSSSAAREIEVFPPKNFESETSNTEIPEILKRTLSQSVSTELPSDPVDVVITYSVLGEYELDIVRRLTRQLEMVGMSVWAERLGDSSRARKSDKTAQAILGAKVLIVMLSEGSSGQRFIRDHVAIATMTNMSIFPVASEPPSDVKDAMPKELKVQLTPYAWTELNGGNEDSFLFQLRSLARSVQDEVEERNAATSNGVVHRGNLQRKKSLANQGMTASASNFWDVHFGHRESVKWERLEQTLKDTFKMVINDTIAGDLQTILFTSIRNKTTMANSSSVNKTNFVAMCQSSKTNEVDVWEAIVQVAGMVQAVRDVFEVESTVRHLAVEYTEHFSNPSVVSALRDLLSDPDPNFRSVAVVSLARCAATQSDSESLEFVERTLDDEDRLVREAGCLALGHLRAESAVKKLIHVWRNDVISQVREAAKMSLDQIGGEEVIDAMRVTDVLANEIRELTNET